MSVEANSSVPWVNSEIVGEVDTVDEAVRQWLNQNGITDLTNLTKEQLDHLIAFLGGSNYANIPGVQNLIVQLQQISSSWSTNSNADPLSALKTNTTNQIAFLNALAASTTGTDSLDTALSNLQTTLTTINTATGLLNLPTGAWDPNTNINSLMTAQNLLNQLIELENQGIDLGALGLANLKNELQAAVNAYHASPNQNGNNDLRLSQLREAMARAKINYLRNVLGLPESDPRVAAEQAIVRGEETFQSMLNSPNWNPSTLPDPGDLTIESLNQNLGDLRTAYTMALDSGESPEVLAHINSRIRSTETAIAQLESGQDPTGVFMNFIISSINNDIAELTRLEEAALRNNNQQLANTYKTRKEALMHIQDQAFESFRDVLERYSDYWLASSRI